MNSPLYIPDLCFSPLMSVPKEETKRRVIVDFSFPPGKSVNDGISRTTYLDFDVEFKDLFNSSRDDDSTTVIAELLSKLKTLGKADIN